MTSGKDHRTLLPGAAILHEEVEPEPRGSPTGQLGSPQNRPVERSPGQSYFYLTVAASARVFMANQFD